MKRVLRPRKVDATRRDFVTAAYDDEAIAEILGTALWSEVNRFNIGARVTWPERSLASGRRQKATGTDG
jgi:hypothetical protein